MNFIKKINKYLLEQYPLIWNTRLVWMLGVNVLIHLLFFVIGYNTVNTIEDLKLYHKLNYFFFQTSVVYYNMLISILIILVWIIFYLRNNAFKHIYSLKKGMLFKQFCIIFCILFISISQYFSFKQGLIVKVKQLYSWEEVNADIKTFNRTALFLTQDQNQYEIDQKKYPKPFPLKVAIENEYDASIHSIDTTRAYIVHKGFNFQFYKTNQKLWEQDKKLWKEDKKNKNLIYYPVEDDFKYRIVKNISQFKNLINPSLLNYSHTLYSSGQDSLDYKKQIKHYEEILTNGNKTRIKGELATFIKLANKYENEHNLTVNEWYKLVNKSDYLLIELINSSDPKDKDYYNNRETVYNSNNIIDSEDGIYRRFVNNVPYSKTLYCSLYNLDNFFKNVYKSYYPDFEKELFYFLIGFAFILGLLLFIFKTTDIKSFLLSIVASIIVLVIIVWFMSYANYLGNILGVRGYMESIILISMSFIIIVFSIVSYLTKWKKTVTSILLSLALFAFPMFLLSMFISYEKYTREQGSSMGLYNTIQNPFVNWFELYGFWAIMLLWIIYIYVYSMQIRKLKARTN